MEIVNEGGAAHIEAQPLDLFQGIPGQSFLQREGHRTETKDGTWTTSDGDAPVLAFARSCVTEGEIARDAEFPQCEMMGKVSFADSWFPRRAWRSIGSRLHDPDLYCFHCVAAPARPPPPSTAGLRSGLAARCMLFWLRRVGMGCDIELLNSVCSHALNKSTTLTPSITRPVRINWRDLAGVWSPL